jgi:hypothetical protein
MRYRIRNLLVRSVSNAAIVAGILLVCTHASARQKTDIVRMKDGGVLYGEIKSMTFGILKLSTDYLKTVMIEWDHVEHLESTYDFQVEVEDGVKYFGKLEKTSTARELVIVQTSMRLTLDMSRVVRITPIEREFLARVDGYLNLGFSYAKASQVLQLTVDWSTTYRSLKHSLDFSASVTLNRTGGETTTQRQSYSLVYQRLLSGKWFGAGGLGVGQNPELGFESRQMVYAATGFHLRQTNHDIFSVGAGLNINNELGTVSNAYQQSLEANFDLAYSLFQYDSPTTTASLSLIVFPSLTESGRVRSNFNASAGREVIHNLNTTLSGWYAYDNKPPSVDAANDDWGIVLSVGWSY